MSHDFKQGDPVKVSYAGTVEHVSVRGRVTVKGPDNHAHMYDQGVSIELIEPEYVHEAIYQDADGLVYEYDGKSADGPFWLRPGWQEEYGFLHPKRPLRKLVPES